MAHAQVNAKDLRGPSIYQGEKAGTLFRDIFCKEAYVIQNNEAYKYDDYKTYLVIGVILSIAVGMYGKFHFLITTAIALVVIAVGRFIFQKKCLDKCAAIDYKPEKKEFFLLSWSREMQTKNLILIIVLSLFMLVLCVFNMKQYAEEEFLRNGYIILTTCTSVFIVGVIAALIIKLTNKK